MQKSGEISAAELLEVSSEASLDDVQDLTLRNKQIRSFSQFCDKLPRLQALSLSHNLLASITGFNQLHNLTSLNINFNQVTSLSGLEGLENLQHLYASNNSIRSVDPLQGLLCLHTLNLFKNSISNLDRTTAVLSSLPNLKDLELGMNPCSLVPEYKARVVFTLALNVLDGDALTELDRRLAGEYMDANVTEVRLYSEGDKAALLSNDATSGLTPLGGHVASSQDLHQPKELSRPGTASRPSSSASIQLLTDEMLNDHPILLEYLARFVLAEGINLIQAEGNSKNKSSFVSKLRHTASTMSSTEHMNPHDISSKDCMPSSSLKTAAVESLISASTPNDIIRQLIKLCEVLIKEVELLRQTKLNVTGRPWSAGRPPTASRPVTSAPGTPTSNGSQAPGTSTAAASSNGSTLEVDGLRLEVETLTRQVKVLTSENANIYWLAEENKKLRRELKEQQAQLNGPGDKT